MGPLLQLQLGLEEIALHAELARDSLGVGDLGAEDMDDMTAARHFFDEVNGFGRTAAGGRIERFVREERDAKRRWHVQTLGILGGGFNFIFLI